VADKDLMILQLKTQMDIHSRPKPFLEAEVQVSFPEAAGDCREDHCQLLESLRADLSMRDSLISDMSHLQECLKSELDSVRAQLTRAQLEAQQRDQLVCDLRTQQHGLKEELAASRSEAAGAQGQLAEERQQSAAACWENGTGCKAELQSAFVSEQERASGLEMTLQEARREIAEIAAAAAAAEATRQALGTLEPAHQRQLASLLSACQHELSLLLQAIRAQLQGGDAITVLLDSNGELDSREVELLAAMEGPNLGEAACRVCQLIHRDLEALREIVSTKSAENAADGCVIS